MFEACGQPTEKPEWVITADCDGKGFYRITSKADGRYLNEYADFGTNPYAPDWNTYLILVKDNKYSIQTTQNSGIHFWNINTDRLSQDKNITRSQSYVIEIIKK